MPHNTPAVPLRRRLQILGLSAVITSPAAIPAALKWRHWFTAPPDEFAWLSLLLALAATALWLVILFIHWDTRLRKDRLLVANKRKDE